LLYKRNCAEDKNRTYRLGENIFKLHNWKWTRIWNISRTLKIQQ
jgi:hypothetical protein